MLHTFRRQIEQLNSPLLEILRHAALFQTAETGVERRRGNHYWYNGRCWVHLRNGEFHPVSSRYCR